MNADHIILQKVPKNVLNGDLIWKQTNQQQKQPKNSLSEVFHSTSFSLIFVLFLFVLLYRNTGKPLSVFSVQNKIVLKCMHI